MLKKSKIIKLISYLLILIILLTPFKVLACPHVDEQGRLHFAFYNEDWTIVTKMYPQRLHLFSQEVSMDDSTHLYSESFGFPIVKSREAHLSMYALFDEMFINMSNEQWQQVGSLELTTTVENIDRMLVNGTNFNLNIGLTNTFQNSVRNLAHDIYEKYFNIHARRLNDLTNRNSDYFIRTNRMITQRNLELVVPEILQITAEKTTINDNWETNEIQVNQLHDPIEIQIYANQRNHEVVAINLNQELNSNNLIEVAFDEVNQRYFFEIEEPGIFALINTNFNTELFDYEFPEDEENDATIPLEEEYSNISNLFIIIPSVILILVFLFLIYQTVKSIKNSSR